MTQKLKSKKEVIAFIGKKYTLQFTGMTDGMVEFETLIPKKINGNYYHIKIRFSINPLSSFRYRESAGELLDSRVCKEVIELLMINLGGENETECIYRNF